MKLTFANSPCADDVFMFHPLSTGNVDTQGLEFTEAWEDIETLNRKAEEGVYDVTAISFVQYPKIEEKYILLPTGGCFGDSYGPVLVSDRLLKPRQTLRLRAAIPGKRTTAFLLLRLWERSIAGEGRSGLSYTDVPFDQIMERVAQKKMDLGLLIHEGQLTYLEKGLQKVVDLGEWWKKQTGLPVPLGAVVIRRDIDWETQKKIALVLRQSIEFALANREGPLEAALPYARGLDRERVDHYIQMYVNPMTVDWGRKGLRAIRLLFEKGYQNGLLDSKVVLEGAILDLKGPPSSIIESSPPISEELPQVPTSDFEKP